MKKHKLDLELALPSEAAACDACVGRMVDALGATRGITRVHVDREDAARPRLCLHYDPTSVRLEEVEALVTPHGFRTRRTGPSVSVLRAEALPTSVLDALPDGVRRPANLEDVFVLLTGERLED